MLKEGKVVAINQQSVQVEEDAIEDQIAVDAAVMARQVAGIIEAEWPVHRAIIDQQHPKIVSLHLMKAIL